MRVKTIALEDLANIRVRRGVWWLEEKAPYDWARRMLDVNERGQARVRWREITRTEGPLQFAFENCSEMVNSIMERRVTLTSIADHLGLSKTFLFSHGFDDGCMLRNVSKIYHETLADAWERALFSYAKPQHPPIRHPLYVGFTPPRQRKRVMPNPIL